MPKAITNTKVTQRKYVENSSDDSDDGDGPPPFCCPSGLSTLPSMPIGKFDCPLHRWRDGVQLLCECSQSSKPPLPADKIALLEGMYIHEPNNLSTNYIHIFISLTECIDYKFGQGTVQANREILTKNAVRSAWAGGILRNNWIEKLTKKLNSSTHTR